ncbi:MAG: hypothetical protein ACI3T9_06010 [Romboutsia timonensis]
MTPHELLYLLLSSRGYPETCYGFKVEYCKYCMECDIMVNENVTLENKIKIMKKIIKKLGTINLKFKPVEKYEVEEVLRLF